MGKLNFYVRRITLVAFHMVNNMALAVETFLAFLTVGVLMWFLHCKVCEFIAYVMDLIFTYSGFFKLIMLDKDYPVETGWIFIFSYVFIVIEKLFFKRYIEKYLTEVHCKLIKFFLIFNLFPSIIFGFALINCYK